MNKHVLAILFFGLAVIITWHMDWHRKFLLPNIAAISSFTKDKTPEKKTLSVYINQLERKHFNEQGILTSKAHTDHAFQYSDTPDILHFELPTFYFSGSNALWRGKSTTAIGDFKTELTILQGDVTFSRMEDALTIYSDELSVDNKKQAAYTEKPVKIDHSNSKTQAVGMQLNLETETIQLNSHVHTFYQPDTVH